METSARKNLGIWIIVAVAVLFLPGAAYCGTIYVDSDAPLGGDGASWATAYRDIETAVVNANGLWLICFAPTDSIWVKSGTYNLSNQIDVNKTVAIYGGFPNGMANPGWDDRDWFANPTFVNGGGSPAGVRCFFITQYCQIDGFKIWNGYSTTGAGMHIEAAPEGPCGFLGNTFYLSPRITNCEFAFNHASTAGGAIYVKKHAVDDEASDPSIEGCYFAGNSSGTGGAIYHLNCGPNIDRCVFYQNEASSAGAIGGAFSNSTTGRNATITNSLFYDNEADFYGGAISYNQVYPTITNCTFADNVAGSLGGAFYGFRNSEAPRIRNSICWGNSPSELDIVTSSTYLEVSYCDIEGGWVGPGSNNIDQDPCFLGGNAYPLKNTSPCIDTANNSYGITEDLEEALRPIDGNGDAIATCDMGCYEYNGPDLVVLNIVTNPVSPTEGQLVDIDVTVKNQGGDTAGSFYVDWYAHRTSPPPPGAIGTRAEQVSSLAGGASHTMSRTYTYANSGTFQMYAQVDTDEDVDESNEGNNILGPQAINVLSVNGGPSCWQCPTQCQGDADCDGDVDTVDWPVFRDAWSTVYPESRYNPCGDMDRDGDIDTVDWPAFRDHWQMDPLPGGCPVGGTWPPGP